MAFCDGVVASMDTGKNTDVIYLGFSKDFDTIKHNILVSKFERYELDG